MSVKKKFILSDESINSYGFRVLTAGIDTTLFKRNPVMLLNHCEDDVPGGWTDIAVEGTQLVATTNFDEKDEEALTIANKVDQGFINGASIGFCILETSSDPQLMLPGQTRPTVTKCTLHEASITPLPSNGNALALYDANGQKLTLDSAVLESHKLSLITQNPKPNTDMKLNAKTLTLLNLQVSAVETDVDTAVEALAKRATDAEGALNTFKTAQDTALKAKAEARADKAIADKVWLGANKASLVNLLTLDFDNTEMMLNTIKPVKQLNAQMTEQEVETGGEDRAKWTLTDYRQKDSKALEEMQLNNKASFDKLMADFTKNGK